MCPFPVGFPPTCSAPEPGCCTGVRPPRSYDPTPPPGRAWWTAAPSADGRPVEPAPGRARPCDRYRGTVLPGKGVDHDRQVTPQDRLQEVRQDAEGEAPGQEGEGVGPQAARPLSGPGAPPL